MSVAYVDSSVIVGHAFGEPAAASAIKRLKRFSDLLASPLIEAELLAALRREGRDLDDRWLASLTLVQVDRPLRAEIETVLRAGYMRGADCWHLATALYLAGEPASITFVTLDERQAAVAHVLGFAQ